MVIELFFKCPPKSDSIGHKLGHTKEGFKITIWIVQSNLMCVDYFSRWSLECARPIALKSSESPEFFRYKFWNDKSWQRVLRYIQHQIRFIIYQNYIKDYTGQLYIKELFLKLRPKSFVTLSFELEHNLELIKVSNENDLGILDQFGFLSQAQKIYILFKIIHFRSFLLRISNFGNWKA